MFLESGGGILGIGTPELVSHTYYKTYTMNLIDLCFRYHISVHVLFH